jgi:hypothetical protein
MKFKIILFLILIVAYLAKFGWGGETKFGAPMNYDTRINYYIFLPVFDYEPSHNWGEDMTNYDFHIHLECVLLPFEKYTVWQQSDYPMPQGVMVDGRWCKGYAYGIKPQQYENMRPQTGNTDLAYAWWKIQHDLFGIH